ncbi:hypothetical protein KY358_01760 [Candidatus Woesearchaeota archaeon]|nr:hypothetical protein [Candidatus Woesearchaeota archaeon]
MKRKDLYMRWINENFKKILEFQDAEDRWTKGCFFYPYWMKKKGFVNSRWQEAALSLAWLYNDKKDPELKKRAVDAIDFWCKIQNRNGSFTERQKRESSFAATAFTTFAAAKSIEYIGLEKRWVENLERAGNWLCKNEEHFFTNQQMAAALALLQLWKLTKKDKFLKNSQKKLNIALSNQSKDGFFYERKEIDLCYSSLTLDLLGTYYLMQPSNEILESARRYINLVVNFIYPDGSFGGAYNSRKTGWLILGGFEVFAGKVPLAQYALNKLIKCHLDKIGNVEHLPDDRHICTDLYRLCFAYDNCKNDLSKKEHKRKTNFPDSNLKIIEKKDYIAITNINNTELYSLWHKTGIKIFAKKHEKDNALLDYLRPFGIHRFRRMKYFFPRIKTAKQPKRYEFLEDRIYLETKHKDEFLVSYKNKNNVKIASEDNKVDRTELGKIPLEDTFFYGNRALNFVKFRIDSGKKTERYCIQFE